MPQITPQQQALIREIWDARWKGVLESQNQALTWVFALNAGGIAGMLAYAASRPATWSVKCALALFAIGLLCMVGFSAVMYYSEERAYLGFRADVSDFWLEKIDWAELIRRDGARPIKYYLCEVLAWISAIAGVAGIIFSSYAIL
jgi:hypothetical protein